MEAYGGLVRAVPGLDRPVALSARLGTSDGIPIDDSIFSSVHKRLRWTGSGAKTAFIFSQATGKPIAEGLTVQDALSKHGLVGIGLGDLLFQPQSKQFDSSMNFLRVTLTAAAAADIVTEIVRVLSPHIPAIADGAAQTVIEVATLVFFINAEAAVAYAEGIEMMPKPPRRRFPLREFWIRVLWLIKGR